MIAALAFVIGLGIGMLGAVAKLSRNRVLRGVASAYTTVFRGVPELLVIYLFFFGSSGAVMAVARLFGYTGYIDLGEFTVGTLAVAVISGAYSTEVMRGAILTIPHGQIEAARAFGMHRLLIFRRITLPLMLRVALPGLGNVWQLTLKDTSLVSVTGLAELMRRSEVAAGSTREPFLFYFAAAALYLVLTTLTQGLFHRAERHYQRGLRRLA